MQIFLACFLTLVIETAFLFLCGYRRRDELIVISCVNVISNLCLNLIIMLVFNGNSGAYIYILEALVVAFEFAVYALAFGRSLRLALLTVAANCLSYGLGLLIF